MKSETAGTDDGELRDRILTGVAAVGELDARFRQPLEGFLVGLCDRGDGRSREKAVEIAGQVLADCFMKAPSLLERWQGPDNLEAFLRTAAKNRLRSWWTSAEKRRTEVNSESTSLAHAAGGCDSMDREELEIAREALRAGVAAAAEGCPEGLVFMRLKGVHGVDQRAISRCWGHHEAQTSRRIREAMDLIRKSAVEMAVARGGELTMDVLQLVLQQEPGILLVGEMRGEDPKADDGLLGKLAAGNADTATKREAVERMVSQPQALALFAQMLNRSHLTDTLVIRDPELAGMAARATACLRATLEMIQPSEAAALVTSEMAEVFSDLLALTAADAGTLWLLSPGAAALEAVFNPVEPEIVGMRQPLVSGVVSLVLATGEPAWVSGLSDHARHSPAIDLALGKTTLAMIAVPFMMAGSARGVLSVVRFAGGGSFSKDQTRTVARYADIFAKLMEKILMDKILGGSEIGR